MLLLVDEMGSEVRGRSAHIAQTSIYPQGSIFFECSRPLLRNPRQSWMVMWWLDITLCKPAGIRERAQSVTLRLSLLIWNNPRGDSAGVTHRVSLPVSLSITELQTPRKAIVELE